MDAAVAALPGRIESPDSVGSEMGAADGEAIASSIAERLRKSAVTASGKSGTPQKRFSMSQIATRASIGSTIRAPERAPLAKSISIVLVPKYPQATQVSYTAVGHGPKTFKTSTPSDESSATVTSKCRANIDLSSSAAPSDRTRINRVSP